MSGIPCVLTDPNPCDNIQNVLNTFDNFIFGIGALRGLIGKSGVMPARSRHCIGEQTHRIPLG